MPVAGAGPICQDLSVHHACPSVHKEAQKAVALKSQLACRELRNEQLVGWVRGHLELTYNESLQLRVILVEPCQRHSGYPSVMHVLISNYPQDHQHQCCLQDTVVPDKTEWVQRWTLPTVQAGTQFAKSLRRARFRDSATERAHCSLIIQEHLTIAAEMFQEDADDANRRELTLDWVSSIQNRSLPQANGNTYADVAVLGVWRQAAERQELVE